LGGGRRQENRLKEAKTFGPLDRAAETTTGPDKQKFFASFFQKRSASLSIAQEQKCPRIF
jgi:hypothetical protein